MFGKFHMSIVFFSILLQANVYDCGLKSKFEDLTGLFFRPQKWKDGVIPYVINANTGEFIRNRIVEVVEEYRKGTCIRFVERTNERKFLTIYGNAEWCSSYVGAEFGALFLSENCWNKGDESEAKEAITHEMMHTLGFFHEHSRPDRDDYVIINFTNIKDGHKRNYAKEPQSVFLYDVKKHPYDYSSILHYPAYIGFFSKNETIPVITARDPKAMDIIGSSKTLSPGDIKKINTVYKCPAPNIN